MGIPNSLGPWATLLQVINLTDKVIVKDKI